MFLPVKLHVVSPRFSEGNAIYAHNKSTTFSVLIFTKVINEQQHYFQISHTEFNSKDKINMEGMDRNSFTPST